MLELENSITSMTTHGEFSDGASKTDYTKQWVRIQAVDEDQDLDIAGLDLMFDATLQRLATYKILAIHNDVANVSDPMNIDFPWMQASFGDLSETTALSHMEILQKVTVWCRSTNLNFLEELYSEGKIKSSSNTLVAFIRELKTLMESESYKTVDNVLEELDYSRLSPEIIVASLRVTSSIKHMLLIWQEALERARNELSMRKLDTIELLAGLK